MSERERKLIEAVQKGEKYRDSLVAHTERRSPREFDVGYSGPGYSAWLPLAAIRAVNWVKFAEMSSYPEMVREGDWSGIRDSEPDEIWAMFEIALRELEGDSVSKSAKPNDEPWAALQRLYEAALGNASFIDSEISKVEAEGAREQAVRDFLRVSSALKAASVKGRK